MRYTKWILLSMLGLSTSVQAANQSLTRARALQEELRYDEALSALDEAIQEKSHFNEIVEIYEMRGLIFAALGQRAAAEDAFRRLLVIAPKHELPIYVAPKISQPFERIRTELGGAGAIRASTDAPSEVYVGQPITVGIRLVNDPLGMVDRFEVHQRFAGTTSQKSKVVPSASVARVALDIQFQAESSGIVEFWVVLLDEHGSELGFIGDEKKPSRIAFSPPPPDLAVVNAGPTFAPAQNEPLWEKWWFWTGLSVVAAGAVTAILITNDGGPEIELCPQGSIDCSGISALSW